MHILLVKDFLNNFYDAVYLITYKIILGRQQTFAKQIVIFHFGGVFFLYKIGLIFWNL